MSTPYTQITSPELDQFLDDVIKNIAHDEETDFKKLIVYLFCFTEAKLTKLTTEICEESANFVNRLFSAIEAVLSKKKFLLNSELSPNDVAPIQSLSSSAPKGSNLTYEWCVAFALHWLSKFPGNLDLTNTIKSFLIEIIDIVALHLHGLKHKRNLRNILLSTLNSHVDKLLGYMSLANSEENFSSVHGPLISTATHLFTVVNDYDIASKLVLHTAAYRLQFEALAKRLHFIISSIEPTSMGISPRNSYFKLIDTSKSVLLLSLMSNILLQTDVSYSSVELVLNWIHSHFGSFQSNPTTFHHHMHKFNRATCVSLLKLFILCRQKALLTNFFNSFALRFFDLTQKSAFPSNIFNTLHLLQFQNNNSDTVQYGPLAHAPPPFGDMELDDLRASVFAKEGSSIVDVLNFCIDTPRSYSTYLSQTPGSSAHIESWLDYATMLVGEEHGGGLTELFSDNSTLYTFISVLRKIPCMIANEFDYVTNQCTKCSTLGNKNIYSSVSLHRKQISEIPEAAQFHNVILMQFLLTKHMGNLQSDDLLASNLLLALFNFLSTYRLNERDPDQNKIILNFVLDSLTKRETREVRILAARVLPLFLINQIDQKTDELFKHIFRTLCSVLAYSFKSKHNFAESSLLALAELAIVCEGEWLFVIFNKFIDCLGESNEQHVNITYNSLIYVASAKSLTPYKLLSPFLPSIAERIIKNERVLSRLTELLGISRKYFLSTTREYTTPMLLEYYKHDFIQDISEASNMTKEKLVMKTLSRIMATYLCKVDEINPKYIVNVLSNVCPDYGKVTMSNLIPNVGEVLWYVLLQMRMDDSGIIENEKRINNAILYVGKINWLKKQGTDNATEPPSEDDFDFINDVLRENVLQLAQRFSEIVHQIKGIKPFLEKVNAIKAIQFLIIKNSVAVSWALGQISTCLQAALDSHSLEVHVLRCWFLLVSKVDSRNLVSLFDITISLLFQRFQSFSHRAKAIAAQILRKVFAEIKEKYNQYLPYYYSYAFVKDLDKYFVLDASSLQKLRYRDNLFSELTRRLQTENKIVVHQALDDLINLAGSYQENWQTEKLRETSNEHDISELVRNILDTSVRFKSKDPSISTKCAIVLAGLGALDSNRFNFKTVKSQIKILFDFHNMDENASFLVDFIQSKVIKNFWASNDPVRQLFSVYSMQSFLSVMGLDTSILGADSQGYKSQTWNKFSEVDKSTLTPLLSSHYFASVPKYEPLSFPHYRLGMRFEKWLIDITTNLLRRPIKILAQNRSRAPSMKASIFQTCSMLIRDGEVSISQHLLKYIALSHIVNGDVDVRDDLLKEFLFVLRTDANARGGSERVENLKLCFQGIFEVLDYFNDWVSECTQKLGDPSLSKPEMTSLRLCKTQVLSFLSEIPTELIALTSSQCDSYERTILYLEKCYRDEKASPGDQLSKSNIGKTLQSVYSNIDDFDALDGVLKKFTSNNLTEVLNAFQYNENWNFAQSSFQALSKVGNDEDNISCNTKLLKSFADHALYEDALSYLDSRILDEDYERLPTPWAMVGLSAALTSGDFDQIKKWKQISETLGEPEDIGDMVVLKYSEGVLSSLENKDRVKKIIGNIYELIGQSLKSSMSSSFSQNSDLMRSLHVMFDTSLILSADSNQRALSQHELSTTLHARLQNTDHGFENQWRILSMHKLCNKITKRDDEISKIYIDLSRVARQGHRLDIATKSIMNAMVLNDQDASVEYANLLWDQGKKAEAIKMLHDNISFGTPSQQAKKQLQYAAWLDESSHSSSDTIINEYTKAYMLEKSWSKPYFCLGKYFSKLMESQDDSKGAHERRIISHFSLSLKLDSTYLFEALPKLITVWLDFAQIPRKNANQTKRLAAIENELSASVNDIPAYSWYTSITQLLSRITHSHEGSAAIICSIISRLVTTYPKHSLWYVLSHVKSKDSRRRDRVSKILEALQGTDLGDSLLNAQELFDLLKTIASKKFPKAPKKPISLSRDLRIENIEKRFDSLVIPVRSNLGIRIPASKSERDKAASWSAFPRSASVTFDGFDEAVRVFSSLQMPKQITVRGTDNKPYRLMAKRDDTRKDAKVSEFTNMINRLLLNTSDARKRNLVIENYSVIPLAEDTGVIEFVKDVAPLKEVILSQQKKANIHLSEHKVVTALREAQTVAKSADRYGSNPSERLVATFNKICNDVKPILHQWFIEQFSDPAVWYIARRSYIRTAAVMSIVGYIIGLGDRHCENVLLFKTSGAVLHIDFDCLFEKGVTLPTPEVVPFRLTQNMVDAMGISGIEGTFRIACEVTATLVRENEASLMNILETLIYDPLLDWQTQQNPQEHLKKVRRKIRGLLDEKEGLPMNVHGQVDVLIQQATSVQNLSRMFVGWTPYL